LKKLFQHIRRIELIPFYSKTQTKCTWKTNGKSAIGNDWENVGRYVRKALSNFQKTK